MTLVLLGLKDEVVVGLPFTLEPMLVCGEEMPEKEGRSIFQDILPYLEPSSVASNMPIISLRRINLPKVSE